MKFTPKYRSLSATVIRTGEKMGDVRSDFLNEILKAACTTHRYSKKLRGGSSRRLSTTLPTHDSEGIASKH